MKSKGRPRKNASKARGGQSRFPGWLKWSAPVGLGVVISAVGYFWMSSAQQPMAPSPAAQAAIQQAYAMYQEGRYDEGISLARAQLAREPDAPLLHYTVGILQSAKGDNRTAVAELEEEVKRNPAFADSYKYLGLAHSYLGEIDNAVPNLEKAIQLKPSDVDTYFQLGRTLSQAGRYQEAENYLLKAVHSNNANVYSELGLVYRKLDQETQAIISFRKALAADPRNMPATLNLGQMLMRSGHKDEGERLLKRHTELSRQFDELDHFKRSSKLKGATPSNFLRLARAYIEQENYSEAIQAVQHAAQLDQSNPEAYIQLAKIYLNKGQLNEANQSITRAVQTDPNSFEGSFVLGLTRIANGQMAAAREPLDRSKQLGRWDAEMFRRLGQQHLKAKNFAEAVSAFKQSLVANPQGADSYYGLGLAHYHQDMAESEVAFEKAAELDPQHSDARMALGIINFRMNNRPAGELALREAIRLQKVELFGSESVEMKIQQFAALPQSDSALRVYRQLRQEQ